MELTRRELLRKLFSTLAVTVIVLTIPSRARACLVGKWKIRCPNGHDDIVDQITCNHYCEKCGARAFTGGTGYVVCPKGHANYVATGDQDHRDQWVQSYKCPTDYLECRLDAGTSPRERPDRPDHH